MQQAELQLKSDLLATEQSIAKTKANLEAAKNDYPLDVQRIVNLQSDLNSVEAGKKAIEALQIELF